MAQSPTIDSLIAKIKKEKEALPDTTISLLYQQLGREYQLANDFEGSLNSYENAVEYAVRSASPKQIFNAKMGLALSYMYQGVYSMGLKLYEEALDTEYDYSSEDAEAYLAGIVAMQDIDSGNTEEGLKLLYDLLSVAEKKEDPYVIYLIYQSLALNQFRLQNYQEAIQYYRKAKMATPTMEQRHNPKLMEMNLHTSIGAAFGELEQFDSTLHYLEKALKVAEAENFLFGKAYILINLSGLHYLQKRSELSIQTANEAIDILEKMGVVAHQAYAYNLLGENYLYLLDNPRVASRYFEKAIEIGSSLNVLSEMIDWHKNLANAYYELSLYDKANTLKDSVMAMSERLYEENKLKATLDLEAKYESQKKELEIANQRVSLLEKEASLRKAYLIGGSTVILLLILILWANMARYRMQRDMNNSLKAISLQVKKAGKSLTAKTEDPTSHADFQSANDESETFLQQYKEKLPAEAAQEMESIMVGMTELQKLLEQLPSEELLREQQEQKEKAIEDLKAFNYSISHDLRTPLIKVKNFIDLLKGSVDITTSPQTAAYLEVIRKSVDQMENMIGGLLYYAKMEHAPLRYSTVETADLVREIFDSMQKTDTTLSINGLPTVVTDQVLLKQVFSNLLSNALKFKKEGSSQPHINVSAKSENGQTLFTVSDNGIGFPAQQAEKLFELFHRLPNAVRHDGSGAGLAIVKRVVKRLGGEIWAEGKEGKGASFHFSIPSRPESHHQ